MTTASPQEVVKDPLPLVRYFEIIEDPRMDRCKRYPLENVLLFAFVAILADQQSWYQITEFTEYNLEWFGQFVDVSGGAPSHDTFRRVFSLIEPQWLESILTAWTSQLRQKCGSKLEVVAVDGKSIRSVPWRGSDDGLHLVNAWESSSGLCLGQVAVDTKSNEITAAPELLKTLDIRGAVVTTDAMLAQKSLAKQILDQGADYFLALKANHPLLLEDTKLYFNSQHLEQFGWQTIEKNRGFVEVRRCLVSGDTKGWETLSQWPGLKRVVELSCERWRDGQTSKDTRYFITSVDASAKQYMEIARAHWGIENKLHRTLDVLFLEDACQVHERTTAANLAVLRKLALGLIKQILPTKSLVSKRKRAAYSPDFRKDLLCGAL